MPKRAHAAPTGGAAGGGTCASARSRLGGGGSGAALDGGEAKHRTGSAVGRPPPTTPRDAPGVVLLGS
eukprot:7847005-Alexandrium_andersonii.AAC.1